MNMFYLQLLDVITEIIHRRSIVSQNKSHGTPHKILLRSPTVLSTVESPGVDI